MTKLKRMEFLRKGKAMDNAQITAGRNRVRDHLLKPIDECGMKRQRGQSVDEHKSMRARIVDRLFYMSGENLATLARLLMDQSSKGQWPDEILVLGLAKRLQPPPMDQHPIVFSWLASVEGPAAVAGGFEVHLYRFLNEAKVPPNARQLARIREDAAQWDVEMQRIRQEISEGTVIGSDRANLEAFFKVRGHVHQIIADGQTRRAVAVDGGVA